MRRLLLGLAILLAAFVAVLLLRGRARLHASPRSVMAGPLLPPFAPCVARCSPATIRA